MRSRGRRQWQTWCRRDRVSRAPLSAITRRLSRRRWRRGDRRSGRSPPWRACEAPGPRPQRAQCAVPRSPPTSGGVQRAARCCTHRPPLKCARDARRVPLFSTVTLVARRAGHAGTPGCGLGCAAGALRAGSAEVGRRPICVRCASHCRARGCATKTHKHAVCGWSCSSLPYARSSQSCGSTLHRGVRPGAMVPWGRRLVPKRAGRRLYHQPCLQCPLLHAAAAMPF